MAGAMKKDRQLLFWTDEDFRERLKVAHYKAQISRSEYIRRAVEEKIEREA